MTAHRIATMGTKYKATLRTMETKTKSTIHTMETKTKATILSMETKTEASLQIMKSKTEASLQTMKSKTEDSLQGMETKTKASLQSMENKTRASLQSMKTKTRASLQSMSTKTKATLQSMDTKNKAILQNMESEKQLANQKAVDTNEELIKKLHGIETKATDTYQESTKKLHSIQALQYKLGAVKATLQSENATLKRKNRELEMDCAHAIEEIEVRFYFLCFFKYLVSAFLTSLCLQTLRPTKLMKVARQKGGGVEWSDTVTHLVMELLAHRTPPSCITSNILTVAKVLLPNYECVKELPSVGFVRGCRGTLSYLTKLLASDELARAPKYIEQHSDGTSRRQISIQNNIIRIAVEGGYKNVTLDSACLSVDETSEMIADSILRSFSSGRVMLQEWRDVTAQLYPGCNDLLDRIPQPILLTIAKLAQSGWIMTDTCNTARKYRRLFVAAIIKVAREAGMSEAEIRVFEAGTALCMYYVLHQCPLTTHHCLLFDHLIQTVGSISEIFGLVK